MASFLVILLLLALGAGLVAWHTTGYPHTARPLRRTSVTIGPDQDAPPDAATEPVVAPVVTPQASSTTHADDPFAHAPPLDMEQRQ